MIDFIRLDDALRNITELIPTLSFYVGEAAEFRRWEIAGTILSRVTIQWWEEILDYPLPLYADMKHGLSALKTLEGHYTDHCLHSRQFIDLPAAICFSHLGFDRTELIKTLDGMGVPTSLVKPTTNQAGEASQPWLIADQRDPTPAHTWYIAARYFAREIVKDNPKLSVSRNLIAPRIKQRLIDVGIYKRGGKPYEADTISTL